MANMLEKKFKNVDLGIELTNNKIFGLEEKMLLNYLVIKTLIKQLENMLIMKTKKAAPSKRRVRSDGVLI